MHSVATALLFDRNRQLLIYLRDNKPDIPFPNHWDLFGGHVEPNETPAQALVRELKEELNLDITDFLFFKAFESLDEEKPNTKFVFVVHTKKEANELTLYEGQYLKAIKLSDRGQYRFANMLGHILDDFADSETFRW